MWGQVISNAIVSFRLFKYVKLNGDGNWDGSW
jgi:hypothetical protein